MNPILTKTSAAITAKAKPALRPVIAKLVASGRKVMFAQQNNKMLADQLGDGTDPELIGAGIAKLIGILFNESGKKAPMQAMIPAAVILLCDGLDFIEEARGEPITDEFLAQCTLAMTSNVLQLFGATPEQIQGYINKAGQPGGSPAPTAESAPAGGIVQGAA